MICLVPVGRPFSWRWTGGNGKGGRVEPGRVAFLDTGSAEFVLEAEPTGDGLVVGMRHGAFGEMLEPFRPGLAAGIRDLVFGSLVEAEVEAHPEIASRVAPGFRESPVAGAARAFWFESQFKALVALLCFGPARGEGEFFCSRQKRLARVRVAKAKARLESRLDEAIDLNRLAAEVGCSASYLSRTFSTTTGMTISQHLRKRRIEKAAEMLVSGRYNVSEVAVEVGYQSLSHFSKAFQLEKGCLPSRYEAA